VDYFLVKTVLKNLVPFKRYFKNSDLIFNVVIFMCYNRLCVDMFLLCVIKMTLCVMIFYPFIFEQQQFFKNGIVPTTMTRFLWSLQRIFLMLLFFFTDFFRKIFCFLKRSDFGNGVGKECGGRRDMSLISFF
jgi:hypothetical protein